MLIGSRALAYWSSEFKPRIDSDWDIISPVKIDIKGVEVHYPDEYQSQYILDNFQSGEYIEHEGLRIEVCSLEGLACIKRSHLSLNLMWEKHMATYNKHLKPHLNRKHWKWIKARERIQLEKARQGSSSLRKSVVDFFDDAVTKKYSHDWIHELVAFHDKPLYTCLQPNPEVAWCDKNLWDELPYEDKVRCVAEETSVIAVERWLVPSEWKHYKKLAYYKALNKVCTTLTSGWFRDFAIDNFEAIVNLYRPMLFNQLEEVLP